MRKDMTNSAGRLYRIVSFHRAVQIFENGELFFAHPSSWEDPYETRLAHQDLKRIYAQCWCTNGVSDAMWRIYSPNHLGVRIGTSTKKLSTALEKGVRDTGVQLRMDKVEYISQHNIHLRARVLRDELAKNFDIMKSTDSLFIKREAYEHESEYRVVAIADLARKEPVSDGLRIRVSAKDVIDSILIDPRAPNELAAALIYYFKEKIGFSKKCQKSVLYKTPKSLVIE